MCSLVKETFHFCPAKIFCSLKRQKYLNRELKNDITIVKLSATQTELRRSCNEYLHTVTRLEDHREL